MDQRIAKRKRICPVLSSSDEEDVVMPGTSEVSNVTTQLTASSSATQDILMLTGVVKDLVKVMECQTKSDQHVVRILNPRDNTVPNFNPEDRRQSIDKWCQRIDELKDLYRWNDETTVYNAMSKLTGLAHTWYNSLPTINYSWEEWKVQLYTAFPPKQDFHDILMEMVHRVKRSDESYLNYYYEKFALLNQCQIFGKNAVSCIIGGVYDPMVKAAAKANDYQTCEGLLHFLKTCEAPRQSSSLARMPTYKIPNKFHKRNFVKQQPHTNRSNMGCYQCGSLGHRAQNCTKLLKCFKCGKIGHKKENCSVTKGNKPAGSEQVL